MPQILELSHGEFKIAMITALRDIPSGSVVKNLPANARDSSLGMEDPPEKKSHTLWYSCLGNPMDREAQRATIHGVAKELDMT